MPKVAWGCSVKIYINSVGQIDSQLKMLGDQLRQTMLPDAMGRCQTIEVESQVKVKGRTAAQNNSLHLYLTRLAVALNDAGLDMKTVLKAEVEIPWTQASAKQHLWHPVAQALTGKASSAKASTVELQEIYKVLDRHLSASHGVSVGWPDRFGGDQ